MQEETAIKTRHALRLLIDGQLDGQALEDAFCELFAGNSEDIPFAALLAALSAVGETDEQLTFVHKAIRKQMTSVATDVAALDIVGTGGDGTHSHNISVASAITASACGVTVAKHGNRSVSSLCGSADVLEALGIDINADAAKVQENLHKTGFAFLFARNFHPAMRFAAPIRAALKVRSVFNLLGPISNPASPDFYLVGVFGEKYQAPLAQTLKNAGAKSAWVVRSLSGFDELISLEPNKVVGFEDGGEIRSFTIDPAELGLTSLQQGAKLEDLKGSDPAFNARAISDFAKGEGGEGGEGGGNKTLAETILLNVAAALVLSKKCSDLRQGLELANAAHKSGKVAEKLAELAQ